MFHGLTSPIHARRGLVLTAKRSMDAELWFAELVSSLANVMPDINHKELPACLTVYKIYQMYQEAVQETGGNPLQISQFRRMWKRNFPEVIIPKVKNKKLKLFVF